MNRSRVINRIACRSWLPGPAAVVREATFLDSPLEPVEQVTVEAPVQLLDIERFSPMRHAKHRSREHLPQSGGAALEP